MEKHSYEDISLCFPRMGEKIEIPLISACKREKFQLDVSRSRIDLKKIKYQNRARKTIILVRLELNGSPHRNPDDEEISCPHIHLYREGYGDKWAYPLPIGVFNKINDIHETFYHFMKYCNITKAPDIRRWLL